MIDWTTEASVDTIVGVLHRPLPVPMAARMLSGMLSAATRSSGATFVTTRQRLQRLVGAAERGATENVSAVNASVSSEK